VVFCSGIKNALRYDDSLDAFGIHAVAGILGSIGTGILTAPGFGGIGAEDYDLVGQTIIQAQAVAVAVAWSGVASLIVFGLIKVIGQLRVSKDVEVEGLDINEHGERAYHS
jgi:Amt family ammonium transporter